MGRKIARGFGVAICVLLFVLCVFMIIVSAVFGSEGLVAAFGYNLYLCEESAFEGVPSGSAVVVEQCEPYDLTVGTLILYGSEESQTLGYTEIVSHKDGVYSIAVTDAAGEAQLVSEGDFIGRAGWSSLALGRVISFSLSPWGVFVMAVLPCLALIIYSVIKGVAEELPPPEVVPQVKNAEREQPKPQPNISVKSDGNAEYSRSSNHKPARTADSVLFTYGTKSGKSHAAIRPDTPAEKPQPVRTETSRTAPAATAPARTAPQKQERPVNAGGVPSSVAARKYMDSATAAKTVKPAERKPEPSVKTGADTAELPAVPKKPKSDAFFAQSSAPQIGKQRPSAQNRAVIDLEDALATVNERQNARKAAEGASKRSSDIIASRRRDELMAEDDDRRDKNRYDVDDILAGLDRRRKP